MTRLLLLGAWVISASACATVTTTQTSPLAATGSSWSEARLRDTDGNPLPTYALEDSSQLLEIHCADGNAYQISLDRDGELYTADHKVIYRVAQPGSDQTMCNRILDYRR